VRRLLAIAAVSVSLSFVGFGPFPDDPYAPPGPGGTDWQKKYELEHARSTKRLRLLARSERLRAAEHRGFRRIMLARTDVRQAIDIAAIVYNVSSSMLRRKAYCESKFFALAHNKSGASGIFQFIPSTWRSTPFSSFSVYDPFANVFAGAWMHRVGRGGEWVCQ
jgi:hypothetical protein